MDAASDIDLMRGLTAAVATATFLLDTAEADLSQAEDTVLAEGGIGGAGAGPTDAVGGGLPSSTGGVGCCRAGMEATAASTDTTLVRREP